MQYTHDIIIIGQGLAGTVLSETIADAGLRAMVFDAPLPERASVVAAGIVNPVSLRRTVLSWRASEMLAIAGAFYRDLELELESSIWHPMPMVELFPTAQEAGLWHARMKEKEYAHVLSTDATDDPGIAQLPQPYGHGTIKRCAWLDVPKLLRVHRSRAMANGSLEERKVEPSEVDVRDDGVEVHGRTAPFVVHCAGPFHQLKGLVPVRGEGLTVKLPGLVLRSMVHRGVFMLPVGHELYRIGSTFVWDNVWSGPTDEGKRALLDRLSRVWDGPVQVVDHWAGVRPAARDRRPILGSIGPRRFVFNGLGSRGALLAPWSAEHLVQHLFPGAPLDTEVNCARFESEV
ncbi:MAG TPA: FAD-dependent oxidoreductase [Flavobacteriales bacterium]|nr:FAD-dependent oxidoreductase [Flavobacteriales bacterium]